MPRAAFELSPIVEEEDEAAFRDRVGASLGKHADDIAELHELVYMTVQAATQQWEALSRLCAEFEAVKPATDALEQRVFELRSEVCAVRGVLGTKRDSSLATSAPEDGVMEAPLDLPRSLQPKELFKLLDMEFLSSRLRDGQERLEEVAPVNAPPRTVGSLLQDLRLEDPTISGKALYPLDVKKLKAQMLAMPEDDLSQGSFLQDLCLDPTIYDKGLRPFDLKNMNSRVSVPPEDNSWEDLPQGSLAEPRRADGPLNVENAIGFVHRIQVQSDVDVLPERRLNDTEGALMESRCADVLPEVENKFGSFQRKQAQYHVNVLPPEHDGVNDFAEGLCIQAERSVQFGTGALMESRCAEVLPKAEKKFGSFQRKQAQYHVDVLPPEHDGVNVFTEGSRRLSFERSAKSLGPICLKEFKPHQRASETEEGFCHVELAHGCDLPELDEPDFELDDRDLDRLMEEAPIAVEGVTSHPRTGAMWKRSPDPEFDPDDHEDPLEESHALRVRSPEAVDSTAAEVRVEAAEAGAEQMEFMESEPWAEEVYQL